MSSSMDAGYYASKAQEQRQSKCEKSPNGKHSWQKRGLWPSVWHVCKHCKTTIYSK